MRSVITDGLRAWFQLIETAVSMPGAAYASSLLAATHFIPSIETFTPGLLEEVQGIAEGAGQPFDTMVAYQLMDEEWWYRVSLVRARRGEACSAVGVITNESTSIVAQNMDLPSHYDGTQIVLHLKPADGEEVLVFTPAGMVGTTGLNRSGVAVCCNSLPQLSHRSYGLPVAFMMRGILAQGYIEDAMTMVKTVPHASGQNYLLGGPGAVCNLEASAGQVREVPVAGSQVHHTNHPLANDDIDPSGPADYESRSTTRVRLERLQSELVNLGPRAGVEDLARVLSDREAPVCVSRGSDWMTLGSLIMELSAEPVLHIAPGPPVNTPFHTLAFN